MSHEHLQHPDIIEERDYGPATQTWNCNPCRMTGIKLEGVCPKCNRYRYGKKRKTS